MLSTVQFSFAGEEGVSVKDVWARPVILMSRPGAAYFTIHNEGAVADKLIKASSSFADRVELHVHKHDNGIMKMVQVADIPAPAHGVTMIKPGGYHLMLFGLKKKLAVGDDLPLTLTFAHAGEVKVTAKVMKNAPKMDHSDHSDMKMDHSKMKHDMMK